MSEKTEQATDKKLREARQKGQVPKSRELSSAVVLLALTAALASSAAPLQVGFRSLFELSLASMHTGAEGSLRALTASLTLASTLVLPILLAGMFSGVALTFPVTKRNLGEIARAERAASHVTHEENAALVTVRARVSTVTMKLAPSSAAVPWKRRWLSPTSRRAAWGMTRPTQPMTPETATQPPMITEMTVKTSQREKPTLTPKDRASSSPIESTAMRKRRR